VIPRRRARLAGLGSLSALILVGLAPACVRRMPTGIEIPAGPVGEVTPPAIPTAPAVDESHPEPPSSSPPAIKTPEEPQHPAAPSPAPGPAAPAKPPETAAAIRPPADTPSTPSPVPTPPPEPPANPRLLPDSGPQAKKAIDTLARADALLEILSRRPLSTAQRQERDTGITFIGQAREALVAGDPDRASVLADKAVALIENLELATR
jgi:hypothetical protein